jgi:hypothetical protein
VAATLTVPRSDHCASYVQGHRTPQRFEGHRLPSIQLRLASVTTRRERVRLHRRGREFFGWSLGKRKGLAVSTSANPLVVRGCGGPQ